ncbi:MAG: hypothetical protein ACKOAC_05520, partial [Fluviibacter sp.]
AARRVSLDQLQAFRESLGSDVAICGIGGITCDNIAEISGLVDAVALISEIFGSPDQPTTPEQIHQRLRQLRAEPALL